MDNIGFARSGWQLARGPLPSCLEVEKSKDQILFNTVNHDSMSVSKDTYILYSREATYYFYIATIFASWNTIPIFKDCKAPLFMQPQPQHELQRCKKTSIFLGKAMKSMWLLASTTK